MQPHKMTMITLLGRELSCQGVAGWFSPFLSAPSARNTLLNWAYSGYHFKSVPECEEYWNVITDLVFYQFQMQCFAFIPYQST